jgi:hypothetical protein
MSGGSFDYMYNGIKDMYEGRMKDKVMDKLIKDLCVVLHDLEWWTDGDISEADYRKSVKRFKDKWIGNPDKTTIRMVADILQEAKDLIQGDDDPPEEVL